MGDNCEPWRGSTNTDSARLANRNKDTTDITILPNPSRIVSLHPNPAIDEITVTYDLNEEVKNASIAILSYYHTGIYDNFRIKINSQSRTFPLLNYPIGVYMVALICDGKMVDYKIFTKY